MKYRKKDLSLYVIITGERLKGEWIYPRVPSSRLDDEDGYIKRICCSNSIPGCIRGLGSDELWIGGEEPIVYKLILTGYEQILTPRQVAVSVGDAMETGEWWVLNPCKYEYFGRIKRIKVENNHYGRDHITYILDKTK